MTFAWIDAFLSDNSLALGLSGALLSLTALAAKFEEIVMEEEDTAMGAPVIGAAMAINEEMREHIDNNRVSVRSLPKSAFT